MEITTTNYIESHSIQSMQSALNATQYTTWERKCHEVSDLDFSNSGIYRCILFDDSGRHHLQTLEELDQRMTHSNYYACLKSSRRTDMLKAVAEESYKIHSQEMKDLGVNYLEQFSEFDDYVVEAADGHFTDHACHTKPSKNGITYSAGFIYALDLRLGLLRPLCVVTDGSKRSSEIPAFKKEIEKSMKDNTASKKLYVYDKAIIDYKWWHHQKQYNNYMVSLLKDKAVFKIEKEIEYDRTDEVNIGVEHYYLCSKGNNTFCMVEYRDPETGVLFKFVSTLASTVRPGAIANLYYKRWTIEKAFNNSKSNFKEKKAWGSHIRTLNNQMRFTSMAYNIIRVLEEKSKSDEPELIHPSDKKYTKELNRRQIIAEKVGRFVNPLLFKKRITRISSYTIRAVQLAIYTKTSLRALMDKLSKRLVPRLT